MRLDWGGISVGFYSIWLGGHSAWLGFHQGVCAPPPQGEPSLRRMASFTSHSTPVCPTRQPREETLLSVDTLVETLLSVDTSVPTQISGVRQRRVAENWGPTRHHPGRSWAVARMVPSSGQPAIGREQSLSQFGWDWKMSGSTRVGVLRPRSHGSHARE